MKIRELTERSYNAMRNEGKDILWHLVKYKQATTAFIHFTTVASIACKIGGLLREISKGNTALKRLINLLEEETRVPFEDYCFYVGLMHDYDKFEAHPKVNNVDAFADGLLEKLKVPRDLWSTLKMDAKSCEAGVSESGRHHDLVVKICRLADVLASEDSVFGLKRTRATQKDIDSIVKQLESAGLYFRALHIGSSRLFTVLASSNIIKLLENNGWTALVAYKDGLLFIGTDSSVKVPLDHISEELEKEISSTLYDKDRLIDEIRNSVPRNLRGLIQDVESARIELLDPHAIRNRKPELVILANNLAKALKGEMSVEEALKKTMKETGKGVQSLQKTILPSNRKPIENILKGVDPLIVLQIIEHFLKSSLRVSIPILVYLIVGWSKEEKTVRELYKVIFNEDPPSGFLSICLDVVVKMLRNFNEIEEKGEELLESFKRFLGTIGEEWKYEIKYYVSTYISGDIVEPLKEKFPKTPQRCILCRSPIFAGHVFVGDYERTVDPRAKGGQQMWTPDDVPFEKVDELTQSTKPLAKILRPVCTLCRYEAVKIKNALLEEGGKYINVPFIVAYFRPAISPEILSFIAQNILETLGREPIRLSALYDNEKQFLTQAFRGKNSWQFDPVIVNHLGAFIIINYLFSEDIPEGYRRPNLSGKRDLIYYGLVLIPKIAELAGGGQFKIGLSTLDLLIPPAKIIEAPVGISFIEELNGLIFRLQEEVIRGRFRKEYSSSYYYLMRALEGVAIRLAFWYNRKAAGGEKGTLTWIIRGLEDVDKMYLPITLLSPPPEGFDKRREAKKALKNYRNVYEITHELEIFLSNLLIYLRR